MNKRLFTLDYLRGIGAFIIMIYHYISFFYAEPNAQSFLSRVSYYGVEMFYVLSGLTLFLIYYDNMKPSAEDLKNFYIKRFFRIYPLLWLVLILSLLFHHYNIKPIMLFLNFTGLFGFFDWNHYLGGGLWSIGNELVFYVFFAVFVILSKKYKPLFFFLVFCITAIYIYFAFFILTKYDNSAAAWYDFTNPLNQLFFFMAGYLIGYLLKKVSINKILNSILFFGALALFILIPGKGERIVLISGTNRIYFTICTLLMCFSIYKSSYIFPKYIHKVVSFLGEASYSIYLLHFVAYYFVTRFFHNMPIIAQFILCIICTITSSYIVYKYFEKYFMAMGKRLTSKKMQETAISSLAIKNLSIHHGNWHFVKVSSNEIVYPKYMILMR